MIQCYFSFLECLWLSLSGFSLIWATDIVIKTCQMSIALGFIFFLAFNEFQVKLHKNV